MNTSFESNPGEIEQVAQFLGSRMAGMAAAQAPADWSERLARCGVSFLLSEVIRGVEASSGTLWLLDDSANQLVAALNPTEPEMIGKTQSLAKGLISLALVSGQAICENEVKQSADHDRSIDEQVGKHTVSLMVAPLSFASGIRGVVSLVALGADNSKRFTGADLSRLEDMARIAGRLIENEMLRVLLNRPFGW